ncbi:MAG: hypothetical protein E7267_05370 [Lachnospiraceae bacterium]|nr:hypothetical protein [Lachnospiraceae bacterium]
MRGRVRYVAPVVLMIAFSVQLLCGMSFVNANEEEGNIAEKNQFISVNTQLNEDGLWVYITGDDSAKEVTAVWSAYDNEGVLMNMVSNNVSIPENGLAQFKMEPAWSLDEYSSSLYIWDTENHTPFCNQINYEKGSHMEQTFFAYVYGYITGSNDRDSSLHIAVSTDGKNFEAINSGTGLLYGRNETSEGSKNLLTGIGFAGTALFRGEDGKFGMIAPQQKNSECYYVYFSNNLLDFDEGVLLKSGDADYEYYRGLYEDIMKEAADYATDNEPTLPQGSYAGSYLQITLNEYYTLYNRFNTSEEDEETLNYANPFIMQRADPYICYDEEEECYYFTSTYPAFHNVLGGYDRLIIRKSDTVEGLSDENGGLENERIIWQAPSGGNMSRHIWAPELHKINGRYYMFFAAGNESNVWHIRPYVLVCKEGCDPYLPESWRNADGSYEIHAAESRDSRYFKNMSLDMSYFEHNGKHYVIWADIIGQSALYMQEIDPDKPWVGISDKVIMLTTPEYGWEREGERVNEGASIIKHGGKIFCAFSASGTGPEYCIGGLYADEDSDLMDEKSWTKLGYPLLTSADVAGEYGPGHNCFFYDPNGNPIFVYHARPAECFENKCEWANASPLYDPCRHARIKKMHWSNDGFPILK